MGFGQIIEECVENNDARSQEVLDRIEKEEDERGYSSSYYEGGSSRKLKNGNILLVFGKNAKETLEKSIK